MSLEKILEKIIADAKEETEQIIRESRARAETIKKEADEEAAIRGESYIKEAEREANLQASRIITQTRLESKLDILRLKKELLEEVLDKALGPEFLERRRLRKKVIMKDGVREEEVDGDRFVAELRLRLEKEILEALKI